MNKLSKAIVRGRFIFLGIFIVAIVLSLIAIPKVGQNTDITSYLPEDMDTVEGLQLMKEEFGMDSTIVLTIKDKSIEEMETIIGNIMTVEHIGDVMWLGLFADLETKDISTLDPKLLDMFYVNDTFVIFITLAIGSTEPGAITALNEIESFCSGNYFLGGSAVQSKDMIESSLGESVLYVTVGIIIILIILLLTTRSYIEPFIFLITIGIAILINMGTNIFFGEISIITYAAAAILQLALAMDYSVFMMHTYQEEKERLGDSFLAMESAIPKTFKSVFSSALTTIGGFLALFCMRFTIGMDLGAVLAKGVFLSLLTVIFLQPVLILIFDKLLEKTKHKMIFPKFNKIAYGTVSARNVIVIIGLVVLIPAMIGSSMVQYNYLKMAEIPEPVNEAHATQLEMGSQIIVIVPDTKMSVQYSFLQQANNVDGINQVIGKYSFVPPIFAPAIPDMLNDAFTSENNYTYYMIMLEGSDEDPTTQGILSEITDICDATFSNFYITGNPQAIKDLASITPTDLQVVNVVSAAIIFLILLLSMRKFGLSLLILIIVELGIFINLSITAFTGTSINFMSYIIISAIQLGATVDYAIYLVNKYIENRKTMGNSVAVYRSILDSTQTILTCMLILASACLSVFFISTNLIVGEITMLIARGAALSAVLVLVLLPACLLVFGNMGDMNKIKRVGKMKKQRKIDKKAKSEEVIVDEDVLNAQIEKDRILEEKRLKKIEEELAFEQKLMSEDIKRTEALSGNADGLAVDVDANGKED